MAAADIENVTTTADKLKLALAIVLVLASLGGYYGLSAQGVWVQWGVLLACLVAAVVVFLVSLQGRQFIGFGRDAWREVQKVVIMALFLWFTDKTLEWVLYDLILGWKK